jgi:hypothetical protein
MRICQNCGTTLQYEDDFCIGCGANLWLQSSGHLRRQWNPTLDEAISLHWLAQAERRLDFPTDSSEQVPFQAFEYAWKVLNRLYNLLSVPKIVVPETNKKKERSAKEKALYLLQYYGVTQRIIDSNKDKIRYLCDCVLEISDKAYLGEKRGFVSFEDSAPEEQKKLRKSAMAKCKRLADSMDAPINYDQAAELLIETLLSVRNARVHASVPKQQGPEEEELPVGGESHSDVRSRGAIKKPHDGDKQTPSPKPYDGNTQTPPADPPVRRSDYEVNIVARIQLSIGKILIAAKIGESEDAVDDLVKSKMSEIIREIYQSVMGWEPILSQ